MYAVIRIRGSTNLSSKIKRAFKQINLTKANHLVLLPQDEYAKGQLKLLNPYITYGTITTSTLAKLLEKRAKQKGNKPITADWLKEKGFNSFIELADAIIKKNIKLSTLGLKPVLRLHPPRKGFERKGIKKPFKDGGAYGFRGDAINSLIIKMM